MSRVTMYTTEWCTYCTHLKKAMDARGIEFSEVDIESQPEAGETIETLTGGYRTVPTLDVCGKFLVNPGIAEVVAALGDCN